MAKKEAKKSNASKVWSIILMAVGAMIILSAFTAETFSDGLIVFITGLIILLIGAGIMYLRIRKAKEKEKAREAQIQADIKAQKEKEKAEAEKKAKIKAWHDSEKKLQFDVAMTEKYQKNLKKIYDKENAESTDNDEDEYYFSPSYTIDPYLSSDGETVRFSVMVDDELKIGEVPEQLYSQIDDIRYNKKVTSIFCDIYQEMGEDGYIYKAHFSLGYHNKDEESPYEHKLNA